jgi:hypothetical protein
VNPLGPLVRLIALLLLVVGLPFVCLGLYEVFEVQQMLSDFARVQGTVVDNTYITTNDGGAESGAYYPVAEFTPLDGSPVRFTDGIGSLPPDYAVGAQVPVLYDPADVRSARIHSWKRLWFAPTLFIAIGLLPSAVFLVVQAAWRLTHRQQPGLPLPFQARSGGPGG